MAPLHPHFCYSQTASQGSAGFQQFQNPFTAGIFIFSIFRSACSLLHQLSFFHLTPLIQGDVEVGIVTH